jgi:hypothetical protein
MAGNTLNLIISFLNIEQATVHVTEFETGEDTTWRTRKASRNAASLFVDSLPVRCRVGFSPAQSGNALPRRLARVSHLPALNGSLFSIDEFVCKFALH